LSLEDKEAAAAASSEDEEEPADGPQIDPETCYCLSEAGEGAMAWEATLQSMFPKTPAFFNRLLSDGKNNRLSSRVLR
jgi:hypothetical protein